MKTKFHLSLGAIATCAALFMAPAQAQNTSAATETVTTTAAEKVDGSAKQNRKALPDRTDWISLKQAFDALDKAGHKDLHGIHLSRDGYVAHALDENQKRVLLKVDPKTSAVSVLEAQKQHKHKRHHRRDAKN